LTGKTVNIRRKTIANRNSAGFGLIPTRVLGQGPSTAGFGQYWIDLVIVPQYTTEKLFTALLDLY
jgi:hypothetical protein